ncbi:MAG TPA: L-histidine N(alpha)-methyltransferase [Baekduia sp.]|nr:L-histidine N(alpha)-methyltransferase [Baekduia sp.]
MTFTSDGRVVIERPLEDGDDRTLADDVLDGLTHHFKDLPPKHLYDTVGAELFDLICEQPEYYPTRTERAILEQNAAAMIELTGATEIVELGSGTAAKTRLLLEAMADAGHLDLYVPVDVTESMVRASASAIATEFPSLNVHGIVGDFERHLDHIPKPRGPRIVMVLGGTIGNLTQGKRRRFLRSLSKLLGDDGFLLIGTDLVKEPAVIEAAYNDAAGVTAAFNLNVLTVINRELNADFDVAAFEHVSFFDRQREWIEMRLRALRPMRVRIADLDLTVSFAAGEEMRTEISTKFTPARLESDLAAAGLEPAARYTDPEELYALTLARARTAR